LTVQHFREWALGLVLDTGEQWVLEDFQAAFVGDVFKGYPEAWLVVPEENTKTTTAAGLALYHGEHRPTAAVAIAAASKEQPAGCTVRRRVRAALPRLRRIWKRRRGCGGSRTPRAGGGSMIGVFSADDRRGWCDPDVVHHRRAAPAPRPQAYRVWRGVGKRGRSWSRSMRRASPAASSRRHGR
jgi:hypothetical protein